MGAKLSRRRVLRLFWGGVAAAAVPATILGAGSATFGDELTSFDPSEPKTGERIGFLFSGHRNRHDAAVEMYDKGEIDVLVVLGVKKEDSTKFIRRARARIQIKAMIEAKAKGISPAIGTPMVTRTDKQIFFYKGSDASVDTSTDASGACMWLRDNQNGWLEDKRSVTAIFISDTLHITRCILNLRKSFHIIPDDVKLKLQIKQMAIRRPNVSIVERLKEWGKLGLQRTTGIDRRPDWLRKTAQIASKPTHG